jgi:hypothetical protein
VVEIPMPRRTLTVVALALLVAAADVRAQSPRCDPAYPDFCIPPPPPDLNCADVAPHANFTVRPPDPHGFDRDRDGIGCER